MASNLDPKGPRGEHGARRACAGLAGITRTADRLPGARCVQAVPLPLQAKQKTPSRGRPGTRTALTWRPRQALSVGIQEQSGDHLAAPGCCPSVRPRNGPPRTSGAAGSGPPRNSDGGVPRSCGGQNWGGGPGGGGCALQLRPRGPPRVGGASATLPFLGGHLLPPGRAGGRGAGAALMLKCDGGDC